MPTKCYPFITVLYFFRYFFAFLYLPLFLFPSAKSRRKKIGLTRQTRISLLPCRNFFLPVSPTHQAHCSHTEDTLGPDN